MGDLKKYLGEDFLGRARSEGVDIARKRQEYDLAQSMLKGQMGAYGAGTPEEMFQKQTESKLRDEEWQRIGKIFNYADDLAKNGHTDEANILLQKAHENDPVMRKYFVSSPTTRLLPNGVKQDDWEPRTPIEKEVVNLSTGEKKIITLTPGKRYAGLTLPTSQGAITFDIQEIPDAPIPATVQAARIKADSEALKRKAAQLGKGKQGYEKARNANLAQIQKMKDAQNKGQLLASIMPNAGPRVSYDSIIAQLESENEGYNALIDADIENAKSSAGVKTPIKKDPKNLRELLAQ